MILDGQGQIAHDLQPESLFLNDLNGRQADRSRYFILRGQQFSGTEMFFLGQAVVLGKTVVTKEIEASDLPKILRKRAARTLENFELPEEVRRGDLVVSTESADLPGVAEVQTFKLNHGELSRNRKPIAATLEILKAK